MEEYQSPYDNFEPIPINDIKGVFKVASYQRGYRWERRQMLQLLNDVDTCAQSGKYYLQPIVVKYIGISSDSKYDGLGEASRNIYELIDGQQRLTSIFLILKYCQNHGLPIAPSFDIDYEIRKESRYFLDNIETADFTAYIDFVYMRHAYRAIGDWLESKSGNGVNNQIFLWKVVTNLLQNVRIFWYEVDKNTDSYELFSNLNIGKIQLNNAELIKALFLCKDETQTSRRGLSEEQQHNIALAWEDIEHQLGNKSLWAFMTNKSQEDFSSRIELLFDIIAGKKKDERDPFYTFIYFNNLLEGKSREEMVEEWVKIKKAFLTFRDWHSDLTYYHKIGYLVAVGDESTLNTLYRESQNIKKSAFEKDVIDAAIRSAIAFDDYSKLGYKRSAETTSILLLHNVLSTLNLNDDQQRFPFHLFKDKKGGWSLEHIHAQRSELLSKEALWLEWIRLHLKSMIRQSDLSQYRENQAFSDLVSDMTRIVEANKCNSDTFQNITQRVSDLMADGEDNSYSDTLSNMALLGKDDNAVLNNSTFDAKRDEIIEMTGRGIYVPICTIRVFLKAYTHSVDVKTYAWTKDDRDAYIENINKVLRPYMKEGEQL